MGDTDKAKKSRWRLSGFRSKKTPEPDTEPNDSAYGGSNASAKSNENDATSSLNTNDSNRPVVTQTQDKRVTPRDAQGNVVTTTTTTTTTTVTTSSGASQEQQVKETRRDDTGQLLERKSVENDSFENVPEMPSSHDELPQRETLSPRPPEAYPPRDGPSPVSPAGNNFSYPRSRQVGQDGRATGTFEGLKTAAAGIHGAGEALRGTLNSAVDKRFDPHPEVAAQKHDAVTARGKEEIDTGRLQHSSKDRHPLKRKGILRKPVGDVR